ncbi:MAG: hypothetical protein ABI230_03790 [Aestuariivirga sp.]
MNRLPIQLSVLAAGLALFASQSQAHTLSSPYFGGEMTGIYRLAYSVKMPSKLGVGVVQDCVDNALQNCSFRPVRKRPR